MMHAWRSGVVHKIDWVALTAGLAVRAASLYKFRFLVSRTLGITVELEG